MSRIGEQIQAARTKQGLTRKQLAKKVGVAEIYIVEVETGAKIIKDDILERITKALDEPISDSLILENYIEPEPEKQPVKATPVRRLKIEDKPELKVEGEIQEVWSSALGSILADVPIFDYNLSKVLEVKQLPVISKKIDGQPKDKVIFLRITDNEMAGYKISKGDLAFGIMTKELENNTFCLVEYQDRRIIRQIKVLDKNKVLLVSNQGSLRTETAEIKEVKVLAKLLKVEITL